MNIITTLVIGSLFAASGASIAGSLAFHLPKHETREISRESMVRGELKWEEDGDESFVVSVYSPGKLVGNLDAVEVDLKKIYDTARASSDVAPFYGFVDEYVVADEQGRWFLIQYEYRMPGSDRHLNRFRIGRLVRIVEGADLFFLVDYMQDCQTKALTTKMAELGEQKSVKDLRGQEYRMRLRAAGEEDAEQ